VKNGTDIQKIEWLSSLINLTYWVAKCGCDDDIGTDKR